MSEAKKLELNAESKRCHAALAFPATATNFSRSAIGGSLSMKLSYRSVSYGAEPTTLEVTEGEIRSMYRGQAWKTHHPKLTRRGLTAPVELIYRGVAYGHR